MTIMGSVVYNNARGILIAFVETSLSSNTSFVQTPSFTYSQFGYGRFQSEYPTNIRTDVELPVAVIIKPGIVYDIDVQLNTSTIHYTYKEFEHLENGTTVDFIHYDNEQSEYSFVSGLHIVGRTKLHQ